MPIRIFTVVMVTTLVPYLITTMIPMTVKLLIFPYACKEKPYSSKK